MHRRRKKTQLPVFDVDALGNRVPFNRAARRQLRAELRDQRAVLRAALRRQIGVSGLPDAARARLLSMVSRGKRDTRLLAEVIEQLRGPVSRRGRARKAA